MKINNISEIQSLIDTCSKLVVTTHTNPDGDAIGSSLALYHFFKAMGKDVALVVPNEYPEFISWLPGNEDIIIHLKESKKAKALLQAADLIFSLDYNALHRSGSLQDILKACGAKKVMIDHHPHPAREDFDLLISTTAISSTAELIYEFILALDDHAIISKEIATCLYVGIMTDTGSFSFACNRPQTFIVTARLLETGINGEWIHRMVYDTFSEDRLRLMGFSLSEKLIVKDEFASAYIALSKDDLNRFNYRVGDTEGLVNYALSIKGIVMAVLLTERKDRIRLSFRSKGDFSVNEIAANHFSGGGHRNAAGGDSFESLDKTIEKLANLLPLYKEAILNTKE